MKLSALTRKTTRSVCFRAFFVRLPSCSNAVWLVASDFSAPLFVLPSRSGRQRNYECDYLCSFSSARILWVSSGDGSVRAKRLMTAAMANEIDSFGSLIGRFDFLNGLDSEVQIHRQRRRRCLYPTSIDRHFRFRSVSCCAAQIRISHLEKTCVASQEG